MIFSPKLPGNTRIEADALQQISALRSTLDHIRSTYRRGTLTHSVGNALAAVAALREELEDAIADDEGSQLIAIATRLESDRIESDGGTVFPLNHAVSRDNNEDPDGFFRDCRVIARAWNAAWSPEQLREKLSTSEAATECGEIAAQALVEYYDEVKGVLQSRL